MTFIDFLKLNRTNNKFATVKEQYHYFGGQKLLNISLRHFQQIACGKRDPTEEFVDKIFPLVARNERRELILSYFEVRLKDRSNNGIIEFLEEHLPIVYPNTNNSMWESKKPHMFLNKEQMIFLISNPSALKKYFILTLNNRISRTDIKIKSDIIEKMVSLDLINVSETEILPVKELLRIPTFETAPPNMTELGTNLILNSLDVFIDKRGSLNQKTLFQLQLVPVDVLERIVNQIEIIKNLIKLHSRDIDDTKDKNKLVPILVSIFYRKFSPGDLE